jgi:ABC-type branched-subunit amino acid transport system substrate-binding protein
VTPVFERCVAGRRCLSPVWLVAALILVSHTTSGCTRKDESAPAGHPEPYNHQLGARLYREGILASGQPIRAVVAGDIRVEGAMFACANCHLRSGLGTTEGAIITPRINAATLFAPLPRGVPWRGPSFSTAEKPVWETPPPWFDAGFLRDAYDREGLAKVIRTGTNAVGQSLDDAMPRFDLEDGDMTALLDYLGQLSAKYSPGVTETTLSFATVVTDEVPRAEREAMLRVLQAYIDTRNAKPRHEKKRARAGPFYRREGDIAYRDIELVTWELKGPPETWREQLERHSRDHPVFALLGGITTGPWSPVHAFCEEHRIPSLFPITDQPVVSETDWYTLYLSKGMHQEGEGAARWLRRLNGLDADARIVQLYRRGGRGEVVARAFEATWTELGRPAPVSQILPTGEKEASAFLDTVLKEQRPQVLMLWLGADAAPLLEDLARRPERPGTVVVAAGLLGEDLSVVPEAARDFTYVTYPYSLPGTKQRAELAVKRWLDARKIPVTNLRLQANIYFLGWMLSGALKGMRNEFYGEYFMETMDMMTDQDWAVVGYPRLSFGPGQRYASKGCYVVQLGPGPTPELRQVSDWVVQ